MTPKRSARARDASGRFLSARVAHQLDSAEAGTVYAYNVGGTIRYRDERGRYVAADIARATRGGVSRVLTRKGERVKMAPTPKGEDVRPPSGWDRVTSLDVRGQSLSRLAESNAVSGHDTFVKWRGRFYRVSPDKAAKLSDTFRVLVSDYLSDFRGHVELRSDAPELTIEVHETSRGDVINMDRLTLFSEGTEEAISGEEGAERAADRFRAHTETLMDALIPPHAKKEAGKSRVRAKGRARTRGKNSKRGGRR